LLNATSARKKHESELKIERAQRIALQQKLDFETKRNASEDKIAEMRAREQAIHEERLRSEQNRMEQARLLWEERLAQQRSITTSVLSNPIRATKNENQDLMMITPQPSASKGAQSKPSSQNTPVHNRFKTDTFNGETLVEK
jgi:hypothetical protein